MNRNSGMSDQGYPWIQADLDRLDVAGNRRQLRSAEPLPGGRIRLDGKELLNYGSNDYLGLMHELPLPTEPLGATGSRLIFGNHPLITALEGALAAWHHKEAALVLGSGYLANLACLATLVSREDVVFADRLSHASLIDGACLSRARLVRYEHNDMTSLARLLDKHSGARRRLIVTESLFSMDGDTAPLSELVRLKDRYGAMLMLDEAHSLGVYGPAGCGLAAEAGIDAAADVIVGTLSKAFGCYGGYIAASEEIIDYLINHARPLIFSTGLPPILAAIACQALTMIQNADDRRRQLTAHATQLRKNLVEIGLNTGTSTTHIVPIIVGSNTAAIDLADFLREHGIAAPGIRPPTVPRGQARVRLSLSAAHRAVDHRLLLTSLEKWARTQKDAEHGNGCPRRPEKA